MNAAGVELQQQVLAMIARGATAPASDAEFDELARAIFAFQYEHCVEYRAYCDRLQVLPGSLAHWTGIPAVPTSAFKDFALTCFPIGEAVAEFHTSGTTREKSGRHYFPTLALYDAAIVASFATHLLSDKAQLPMLILTPSPEEAPHSSLSHMLGIVAEPFGKADSAFYVENGTLRLEELVHDLCEAQWNHQPVFLLGTAFAFAHFLDHWTSRGQRFDLPEGSRIMETGGFKGRSREVPKRELYSLFDRILSVPSNHVVNEYGMTELSTQFYDRTIRVGQPTDSKAVPPWARVLVIDPNTGKPAAQGNRGLLRVFDLANVWSIMCIQTEDLGICPSDGEAGMGFEVLGRAAGAEVRGCSLNAESLRVQ